MGKLSRSCNYVPTNIEKISKYEEYYIGDKDEEKRRNGQGENHWSGAKSIESYKGHLLADTMHGLGEYRWRHLGREGVNFTYEGHFYCNRMHGYGTMSYPDGKVFVGLFHSNMRWGPGIESQACLKEDVGLWRGTQLVRLTWRPSAPSIAPDFNMTSIGKTCVNAKRIMLATRHKTVGETNSAIDLLKQYGSDPKKATEKWNYLYPKNCTDQTSLLCHVEGYEHGYYKQKINMLKEVSSVPEYSAENLSQQSNENRSDKITYFAWNNNKTMVHMMKHCYTHEIQRNTSEINLSKILSGPRQQFKSAGKHETDSRTLLMASFLGHLPNVIRLTNEFGVHPDIADSLGNSAVMYAACGDRTDIIHFLIGAGANVDSHNDACCTPLAVALLRLVCIQKDIPPSVMVEALLPPPTAPSPSFEEPNILEWNFGRDEVINHASGIAKSPSKISRAVSAKKIKSSHSLKDLTGGKKKSEVAKSQAPQETYSIESFDEDKRLYNNINNDFLIMINDLYSYPSTVNPIPYLLQVHDMIKEIDGYDEEPKKTLERVPKKIVSKVIKDTMKPSKEVMWQNVERDETSIDSVEKQKKDTLAQIMLTVLQLLSDGANPKLVKFPAPALFIAIISGYSNLIKHLVNYGADINEVYHETFEYTPLDLAVSRPFSFESLDLIRAILECGAHQNRRLVHKKTSPADPITPQLGPTLLHAVLARKVENETEEEVQIALIQLLLEYNFDPMLQYEGQSPIDVAMSKNIKLLDVFVQSPNVNLNAIINEMQETVLVKMFSMPFFRTVTSAERLQTFTNLLLFGADPLLECRSGNDRFPNIFVFAKKTLFELENSKPTPITTPNKTEYKKSEKPKKDKKDQISTKSTAKMPDDIGDYKQVLDVVVECGRLLNVRWLQAKLIKDLVQIIEKYRHRQWNMILKEHKHKKSCRLWLTTQRCIEIWDILNSTNVKTYKDERILKHLLHIITYYTSKAKIFTSMKVTTQEKHSVEYFVLHILQERKMTSKLATNMSWKKTYVRPELTPKKDENKYNVCFECLLPFNETKIECVSCKLISFCSLECMKINIDRANCHPCSDYLKQIYFTHTPAGSLD